MKNRLLVLMAVLLAGGAGLSIRADVTVPVIGLRNNTPRVTALTNARIVLEPGKVLENGVLIVREGRIEAVGERVAVPPDAVVRDLDGRTIYPAFIDVYTNYGISAEGQAAEQAARHWNEAVRPETRAVEIFSHNERAADIFRKSGFGAVVTFPSRGTIRGNGALVLLGNQPRTSPIVTETKLQSMSILTGASGYPHSLMGRISLIRQTLLDAEWYDQSWRAYNASPKSTAAPEINLGLEALRTTVRESTPVVFEAGNISNFLRSAEIAREFKLNAWVVGSGEEYTLENEVRASGMKLILPLNFPAVPDVADENIAYRTLRHWDFAPENPLRMNQAGVEFALSTAGLDRKEDFLKNLRLAVRRGLDADYALASLTTIPASWLQSSDRLGTLSPGKIANIIIADGDIFEEKTKILETWVAGERYEINPLPEIEIRGKWKLSFSLGILENETEFEISGEALKPQAKIKYGDKTVTAVKTTIEKRLLSVTFLADSLGHQGVARLSGIVRNGTIAGSGIWVDGSGFNWMAELTEPWTAKPDTVKKEPPEPASFRVLYPEAPFGREAMPSQPAVLLVRNATIWTSGPEGILENADLLVRAGKIVQTGRNLKVPESAIIIDGTGKHLTPGLIDAHSHMAMTGGTNEGSHSVTSETRVRDVLNHTDPNIYRHLALGLTTACISHGSANTIGGQNIVIKLRWGATPDKLIYENQRPSLKLALGENVRRSNTSGQQTRYPVTRMGVDQLMRDNFHAAREYAREWEEYRQRSRRQKNLAPPRRNLRLEPLVDILEGKRQIQCHAYRQDEILTLLRTAEELDFKIEFFIHILEGYKVAKELREHGAMPTTFMDVWSAKYETFDGIPHNAAMMHEQELVVSVHSDFPVMYCQMNHEAAKAIKHGGVSREDALKFVTINPAKQLFIDSYTGSLEKGKDADFVIWNGDPLSAYSICEQTWVDGRKYFDREEDVQIRNRMESEKAELLHKAARAGKEAGK